MDRQEGEGKGGNRHKSLAESVVPKSVHCGSQQGEAGWNRCGCGAVGACYAPGCVEGQMPVRRWL